ncbi:MAG: permease [Nitrospinae bacterium]|nr:permease [Nitrospinota bacterium]
MANEALTIFVDYSLDILPFFITALFIASLINYYVPDTTVEKWLKGDKTSTLFTAAFIGTLTPLCTCGLIPLAIALRKKGGDIKHVICFLSSGAACSITVLFITLFFLDAYITLLRFVAAVFFGILTGLLASYLIKDEMIAETDSCSNCGCEKKDEEISFWVRVSDDFQENFKDFFPWIMASLILATFASISVDVHLVKSILGNDSLWSPLTASLIGFPFYFCAGSELPLLKALLAKGMGVGPAVSFMTASPIVNIISFTIIVKWLGAKGTALYFLISIGATTVIGSIIRLVS